MRHESLGLLALLGLTSCVLGTTARGFGPAVTPRGVRTSLEIPGPIKRVSGELIEVGDSALLLALPSAELVSVRYRSIKAASFRQVTVDWTGGARPTPAVLERLRLVSRYPQSLSADRLEALLTASGHPRVRELP